MTSEIDPPKELKNHYLKCIEYYLSFSSVSSAGPSFKPSNLPGWKKETMRILITYGSVTEIEIFLFFEPIWFVRTAPTWR